MKKYFIALVLISFVASCGSSKKEEAGTLTDKKTELQKLKGEQQKLAEQITKLEGELRKADPTAVTASAKLVSVAPIATQDFSHYIELQGRVDAQNISFVSPPNGQGGVVKALYIKQGQSVRKGQVLARLDDQMIRQNIEPLRVQLASAEDTYGRTKNLFDQGIGTYQNVLNAKTQVESLKRSIGVIQTQAGLMTVTAPSAGIIDQLNLRVGEILSPQQDPKAPQIRIVNTGDLKVVASVPENYITRVKEGSKLKVVLPEQNNQTFTATVNVVQRVIDPTTRAFMIEAKIPGGNLKPNQIAQIKILDYSAPNVLAAPLNIVQTDEKGKYVYVLEKNGEKMLARKKMVTVGESYDQLIEIKSGLTAGDQLITEGYQNLYEGQVVTIAK